MKSVVKFLSFTSTDIFLNAFTAKISIVNGVPLNDLQLQKGGQI